MQLRVSGNRVRVEHPTPLVRGTVWQTIDIIYGGEEWVAPTKVAVFTNGVVTKEVTPAGLNTVIPEEVLSIAGARVKAGVYGYTEDNGEIVRAIPTEYVDIGMVLPGAEREPEAEEA